MLNCGLPSMNDRSRAIAVAPEGIFLWPGVPLVGRQRRGFVALNRFDLSDHIARFFGYQATWTFFPNALSVVAAKLNDGSVSDAEECIDAFGLSQVSPNGFRLMCAIAARQNLRPPRIVISQQNRDPVWSEDETEILAKKYDSTAIDATRLAKLFDDSHEMPPTRVDEASCQLYSSEGPTSFGTIRRFNPELHPRWPGGRPEGGRFRPRDGEASPWWGNGPLLAPVVDFSNGFHEAVVQHWAAVLRTNGAIVVEHPAIRIVGPNGTVIGYPDLLIRAPGQPPEILEIKTGQDPPLTPNQALYIPMLQLGGHIYSNDPRVSQLGLTPGIPFPPMRAWIIFAAAPGQEYEVKPVPPPKITPK